MCCAHKTASHTGLFWLPKRQTNGVQPAVVHHARPRAGLIAALIIHLGSGLSAASDQSLDFIVGNFTVHDAAGKEVGVSTAQVAEAGAAIHERRKIGAGREQQLWFYCYTKDKTWRQFFLDRSGGINEFTAREKLPDGTLKLEGSFAPAEGPAVLFRMAITPLADHAHRRHLESSRDNGASWTTVFDYTYRPTATFAPSPAPAARATHGDGREDFDFLMGRWIINNRMLRQRLQKSREWMEFTATHEARHLLDGLGNIDEVRMTLGGRPFIGHSIRVFNPMAKEWSIYWVDNFSSALTPVPVVGRFIGDTGLFYSEETFQNRPIKVRFTWRKLGPDRARWEQAWSADDGATWETNWEMEFTRRNG